MTHAVDLPTQKCRATSLWDMPAPKYLWMSKMFKINIHIDFLRLFLLVLGTEAHNKVLGQFSVSPNQRLSDVAYVFLVRCVVYCLMV